MKKLNLLIVLLTIFFIFSCKKSDNDSISSFKAMKDGTEWISTSNWSNLSKTDNKFLINGIKRNSKYYSEEGLNLTFNISDISESNTVTKFTSSWNYIIGGDVLTDSYVIDTTSDNLIQIISLDTINRNISGTFKVKLLKNKIYSNTGEIMNFTSGQFNLNYQEVYQYNSKSK
ncbi:MAG: hypothetical protein IPJ16_02135 [Bacteroidales bacterium]|nr:hypothetical protein [Bacteroidales bacterium]